MKIKDIIATSTLDKIDTKALLKHMLGLSSAQLITHHERELSDIEYKELQELIRQRGLGVPLSYLLHYKEFYSREFLVTKDTLIPRPETELLVEQALFIAKHMSNNNTLGDTKLKLLDLGTGSGVIAITCKLEFSELEITATDIAAGTLRVAEVNAKRLNACIDFKLSNWYKELPNQWFNIIISNPPYIAKDDIHLVNLKYEPLRALTDYADGLRDLTAIISGAREHLLPNGCLLVEHGYNQKDMVCNLFKQYGFLEVITLKDYAGIDRITYGVNCI